MTHDEIQKLLKKYFDPESDYYVFKQREYDFKTRNNGNGKAPVCKQVGFKK